MKLVNMACPNCGSKLSIDKEINECVCDSCGGKFLLDDESTTQQIKLINAEDAGYEFEKGRQKAQAEVQRNRTNSSSINQRRNSTSPKKSNLKWWILGWICFFPIPLTILVCRTQKLSKNVKIVILSVVWGYVAIATLISSCNKGAQSQSEVNENASNITEFSYSMGTPEELVLTVGDVYERGWVQPSYTRRGYEFSPDDVVFVSENTDVATISLSHVALTDYLYYRIEAVSAGETYVYASSLDGSITSSRIHIIVNGITEAESISLASDNETFILGQTGRLNATITPDDAVDQTINWTSSDEGIITVDSLGNVTAVAPGDAVVTATTSYGISADCGITVDGSQRVVNLSISSVRADDNNIGDEWSYVREINGESVSRGDYTISIGDELSIYLRYSEDDDNPDVGETTVNHTVTEDDFVNGFSEEVELYVTENGGRNSGQSAHFIVTISFEV